MATEVLRPTDVLAERHRLNPASFHRREFSPETGNSTSSAANWKQQRKTSPPTKPDRRRSSHPRRKADVTGDRLAAGQVTLLRRGEPLSPIAPRAAGGNPSEPIRNPAGDLSAVRRKPPPADTYAGSAFSMSPSPRSVPLPSFFNKESNDDATRDLRRLLRLE